MAIKDKLKALIKTTEAIIVLGGVGLIIISPIFGPKIWAGALAVAYILVNVPGIITKIKELLKKKSGNTD